MLITVLSDITYEQIYIYVIKKPSIIDQLIYKGAIRI
jgi:hypothetical protein